jgi:hypothetical protein
VVDDEDDDEEERPVLLLLPRFEVLLLFLRVPLLLVLPLR